MQKVRQIQNNDQLFECEEIFDLFKKSQIDLASNLQHNSQFNCLRSMNKYLEGVLRSYIQNIQ